MAQQPAVVIIARHGPRLDAADQSWHLSTPTPYDPPLTYGGWNQSRALGVRIASLLHAREQQSANDAAASEATLADGVTTYDFASGNKRKDTGWSDQGARKRRKRHKVVIHTSPFLRCVQTSVAIAAGMAQYQPSATESGSRPTSKGRAMHSASPRLRGVEGLASPRLDPIVEPKNDFAHAIARRVLGEPRRHRKSKMRVDAFLGEWLNPQYFDQITPPPPSALMVATAKAELMQNETVDIFTPTLNTKTSNSSLWSGSNVQKPTTSGGSKDSLDEWEEVNTALLPQGIKRDRAGSVSSIGSNESGSGRRSPFRGNHAMQQHISTLPKPELSVYIAPTPQYAVSGSDYIPRGYVSHARQACVDVDYQWDSSRPPQDWGDGGEYGEEWSGMHKRFRKGLNHLVHWYSQHNADDRAEDALGFDQAERHGLDDEEEDLVVIMVTHGAGCNALIGALTGQPVLLDVGMASLTLAIRKDDAPAVSDSKDVLSPEARPRINRHSRSASTLDVGLSSIYEMKLISSAEHLRPGADPTKIPSSTTTTSVGTSGARSGLTALPRRSGTGVDSGTRSNTSTVLGSVRRPSAANINAPPTVQLPGPGNLPRSHTTPATNGSFNTGLWSPAPSVSPALSAAKGKDERGAVFSSLNDPTRELSPDHDRALDFSNSPPDSRPTTSDGAKPSAAPTTPSSMATALNGGFGHDGTTTTSNDDTAANAMTSAEAAAQMIAQANIARDKRGSLSDISSLPTQPPQSLSRALSQKGLWGGGGKGAAVEGDKVKRQWPAGVREPKRRWTLHQDD
ncbi:hypothetical protein BAUCODRAFT_118368 [Baudoinia panamericana UAMH 10762]|uniref:Phosphoglycerate mutase n=1 Tax=Baudoinia panamericana (strain UAMH 10762) TaxID=717646 RepID=M2NN24_BAUPA|nr:uncharacterized protein BAUCODRAFT_118368 [Baudoinia panamericana UAMH 10762]EMD00616.1 hypothetical protein BAUCODRAFT_118368 [Baudoinia panamericana UAMH 10762]